MLVASQGSGIASLLGPLLGVQSGFFSTPSGRLNRHLKAVEKSHGTKLSVEQKQEFLLKTPLIGIDLLPESLKRKAYAASRKKAIPLFRLKKKEIADQDGETLRRREEEAKKKERTDAKALKKYQDSINFPVYTSMQELNDVLFAKHSSGTSKYTPKMQCEIIEKQLQHRRDCYARTLKEGALHSSHKGGSVTKVTKLLESFKDILADEKETPGLLEPPQIRQVYKQHSFATELRKNLDKVLQLG